MKINSTSLSTQSRFINYSSDVIIASQIALQCLCQAFHILGRLNVIFFFDFKTYGERHHRVRILKLFQRYIRTWTILQSKIFPLSTKSKRFRVTFVVFQLFSLRDWKEMLYPFCIKMKNWGSSNGTQNRYG